MQISLLKRSAIVGLLLAVAACARNNSADAEIGAARDSTTASTSDSAVQHPDESGVTDSSGLSTLGPAAQKTRPDQGQPVTSKGDTVNPGIDSSPTPR